MGFKLSPGTYRETRDLHKCTFLLPVYKLQLLNELTFPVAPARGRCVGLKVNIFIGQMSVMIYGNFADPPEDTFFNAFKTCWVSTQPTTW